MNIDKKIENKNKACFDINKLDNIKIEATLSSRDNVKSVNSHNSSNHKHLISFHGKSNFSPNQH